MIAMLRPLLLVLAAVLLGPALTADVLVHKDGRRIEGKLVSKNDREVVFETKFATLKFPAKDVVEIVEEKTRDEIYEERLAKAKTADDFHALGTWCEENKWRRRGRKHHEKAVELDPMHEGANLALGRVKYKGEWMTPEERDARQRAEREAEMAERGLVQHEGRWVTPEEKEKLEQGLVYFQNRWMTLEESMRLQGKVLYDGRWIGAEEGHALRAIAQMSDAAGAPLGHAFGANVVVAGNAGAGVLANIAERADHVRGWFGERWSVEPGLALFDDRLAELYAFVSDAPYERSIPVTVERSKWVPEGWGKAVKRRYGYTWVDPVRISSATLRNRPDTHLDGTCYHNFGHLLAISLGYDGRNLPAWYEEGIACLIEEIAHEQNTVFCKASSGGLGGSTSGNVHRPEFDDKAMRDDGWRKRLLEALGKGGIEPFDKLAQREFHQLALVDIATSRAILEWLLTHGEGTLGKFHTVLRRHAPQQPNRVITVGRARHACYDQAFEAAVGMNHRRADAEWRNWFKREGWKSK